MISADWDRGHAKRRHSGIRVTGIFGIGIDPSFRLGVHRIMQDYCFWISQNHSHILFGRRTYFHLLNLAMRNKVLSSSAGPYGQTDEKH